MAVDILSDSKALLNINDTSKDGVLNIYIRRAVPLIQSYLQLKTEPITETDYNGNIINTIQPIDVLLTYPDAVIEYTVENYRKRGNEGIKQGSQGSRSQTYDNALSDVVKALLPAPFVKLMGSGRKGYYYGY